MACLLPFALMILLGGMLPPIDFDVREYHLQAPKEFYQQGRIGFLPHNVYANMPLGTEMLSLLGMVVSGDWWLGALAGKTLIASYAILTRPWRWRPPAGDSMGRGWEMSPRSSISRSPGSSRCRRWGWWTGPWRSTS